MITLSKNAITTYVGDVVHIELLGDGISADSEIFWTSDENVARVRTFPELNNAVLVSVWEAGEGYVKAEFCGKVYTATVCAREMSEFNGEYNYYFADLHTHTSGIHKHDQFALHETENIEDYVNSISKDEVLSLAVITDHACVTNDYDFSRGFKLVENLEKPIVFAGAESEIKFVETDRFGVQHRHSGEIVTLMSAGYKHSTTYEEFEENMKYSKAPVAVFAHPHTVGSSTPGIWSFEYSDHNTELMKHIIRGIEMGSGTDGKCNILHEYAISAALDAGFKVSTTCSSDAHGPKYGYDVIPGKTVIMATEHSKEAFHEALRANRFYATESGDVRLKYSVNGCEAPTTLALTDTYSFKITLDTFSGNKDTMPRVCQVISDYGKTVHECNIYNNVTEFTVKSDSARYFYIRLTDASGAKTWSMPIWCGRELDKVQKPNLCPIDASEFKVSSHNGDVGALIDGNPENPVFFDKHNPEIIIDMGKEQSISALGYYAHIVRKIRTPIDEKAAAEMRMLVSEYKIHTSVDGVNYRTVAHKVSQSLAGEAITLFDTHVARFVKFEVLSNVGVSSLRENYKNTNTAIGNLTIFKNAK